MRIERRLRLCQNHTDRVLGAVLIADSEEESKIIDELFGNAVLDGDGLIARRTVEVRLSDGFREHYLHVLPARDIDLIGGHRSGNQDRLTVAEELA